jgi:hypothetical protein
MIPEPAAVFYAFATIGDFASGAVVAGATGTSPAVMQPIGIRPLGAIATSAAETMRECVVATMAGDLFTFAFRSMVRRCTD